MPKEEKDKSSTGIGDVLTASCTSCRERKVKCDSVRRPTPCLNSSVWSGELIPFAPSRQSGQAEMRDMPEESGEGVLVPSKAEAGPQGRSRQSEPRDEVRSGRLPSFGPVYSLMTSHPYCS
jgi:hypothetical protein